MLAVPLDWNETVANTTEGKTSLTISVVHLFVVFRFNKYLCAYCMQRSDLININLLSVQQRALEWVRFHFATIHNNNQYINVTQENNLLIIYLKRRKKQKHKRSAINSSVAGIGKYLIYCGGRHKNHEAIAVFSLPRSYLFVRRMDEWKKVKQNVHEHRTPSQTLESISFVTPGNSVNMGKA